LVPQAGLFGQPQIRRRETAELIDGSGLLALCQEYKIPARILNHNKRKPTASAPCRSAQHLAQQRLGGVNGLLKQLRAQTAASDTASVVTVTGVANRAPCWRHTYKGVATGHKLMTNIPIAQARRHCPYVAARLR
jgi:hypothetical protein